MSDWQRLDGELAAWGRGAGPRLVFVHGFTQTSESWKPIADHFASTGYEAIVVDAPGHGESAALRADLYQAATIATRQLGPGVYIGYSMGGRLCLHAAAMYPREVIGVAVIGASPGIADEGDRALRHTADEQLAAHLEAIGVDAFLDEWLAQPMFDGLQLTDEQRADRLRNSVEGLAASLRLAGTGAQASLWPRLGEMTMPILAMAGELDHKFATTCHKIALGASAGRFEPIAGAGHAAHLQDPGRVITVLDGWLRDIGW
jgi:2-succinyl-6-hydroxy-2,4-cyclohexadiene-1-carboxylate synthase